MCGKYSGVRLHVRRTAATAAAAAAASALGAFRLPLVEEDPAQELGEGPDVHEGVVEGRGRDAHDVGLAHVADDAGGGEAAVDVLDAPGFEGERQLAPSGVGVSRGEDEDLLAQDLVSLQRRTDRQTDRQTGEATRSFVRLLVHEFDGWMGGWMDGWMDGWIDSSILRGQSVRHDLPNRKLSIDSLSFLAS